MESLKIHEIPGCVTVSHGKGGLAVIHIETRWSTAEIYQHGAHVTAFQKINEAPLLFMSSASEFDAKHPIRGGVPVIFPWFGARDGMAAHGFARIAAWDLVETLALPDGAVCLHFRLPSEDESQVDFIVTVANTLTMELTVTNTGTSDFSFETCLHTYFHIGSIHEVEIIGLQGTHYRDQVSGAHLTENQESIRFTSETDRVYQDSSEKIEIRDTKLQRSIFIHKSGSNSTVVWNPWVEKSIRMPDFGNEEYPFMVCVESGNVRENTLSLAPSETASMKVILESSALR